MERNEDTQPQSTVNTDKSREHTKATENTNCSNLREQSSPTLLSYDQPSALTPKYNDAGIYATRPNPSTQPANKPRANPNPSNQPISAAALSAVMATSNSSTDKMHPQSSSSRKVDDWNEDPTYKSRLASMVGSTRKWNYFGADIGGNPFRRKK